MIEVSRSVVMSDRLNTILCGFDTRSPRVNAFYINEWIYENLQGGSNMTGTDCGLFTHKSVPVIFEPTCAYSWREHKDDTDRWATKTCLHKVHR